jgi:tetratricopeptide (TPR) repeat protein
MRPFGLLISIVVVSAAAASPARADDDAVFVQQALDALEKGTTDPQFQLKTLIEHAPRAIPTLDAFLDRAHVSTVDDRRALLKSIQADVPNKDGKFETPKRQTGSEVRADDNFDWFAELAKLDYDTPGVPGALGETLADVAAMRALSATKRIDAAQVILDVGFAEATMIYRDECGRQLRAMAPYSLPALQIASQSDNKPMARYSSYQLERLDRQEPGKAFGATASDEDLRVALIEAFGKAHHREAVPVVLKATDNDASRVRKAARAAWLEYVAGRPPKPAPKKKLVLPGGKLADKETPLWLTWRELAAIELARTNEEVLGSVFTYKESGVPDTDLVAQSNELFAHYDAERAKKDGVAFDWAIKAATSGDVSGAAAALDRLLAANPDFAQRADAAPIYLQLAKEHEKKKEWEGAAAAYGKAFGIAPEGKDSIDAQAGREYALGKLLEANGKDGSANFRRAVALKPDYGPARAAAAKDNPSKKPWLLWAAAAGAAFAMGFLIMGLRRRRQPVH